MEINIFNSKSKFLKMRNDLILEIYSFLEDENLLKDHFKLCKKISKLIMKIPLKIEGGLEKIQKFSKKFLNINFVEIPPEAELDDFKIEKLIKIDLPNLRNLYLSGFDIGPSGIKYLSSGDYNKLEDLRIFSYNMKFDKIKFFENFEFPNLRKLNLAFNNIGPMLIESLSNLNFLNLREIDLKYNQIGNKGMEFVKIPPCLEVIDLSNNNIESKGIKYLTKNDLSRIKILKIMFNSIEDGICHLADKNLFNLEELNVSHNNIRGFTENKADWVKITNEFLARFNFPNLKILDFSYNYLGNNGLKSLSKNYFFKLKKIFINVNYICLGAIKYLVKNKFPCLEECNIGGNYFGNKGFKLLLNWNLPELRILNVSECKIKDNGLDYLLDAKIPKLIHLNLCYNKFRNRRKEEFFDHIRKIHPELKKLEIYENEKFYFTSDEADINEKIRDDGNLNELSDYYEKNDYLD